MTSFAAISTFNLGGLQVYGRRMVESFCWRWPREVTLHLYSEGWGADELLAYSQPLPAALSRLAAETCVIGDLAPASSWLSDFKTRHQGRTFRDFRWDAVRFSHKVAAVCHAARTIDADVMIWLDGDIFTHSDVALDDLDGLRPRDGEWISWLYRKSMYPECGFYMLDLKHPRHEEMIATLEAMYAQDLLFGLSEYHDSYVLQHVVEASRIAWRSLSGVGGVTTHPLINGPLGQWFDHLKGNRKRLGRSKASDLKVARTEGYWR